MPSIYIPTYRRGEASEGRKLWADLRICLLSIEAYALDYVDEVVVAWDGPWEPDDMPTDPKFRYLKRPEGMNQIEAFTYCIEQCKTDELIQMNDDIVLHPEAIKELLEDVATINRSNPGIKIGLVGMRSNYVLGKQNIRHLNGGVLSANGMWISTESDIIESNDFIIPFVAYFTREAWNAVNGMALDLVMYSDLVLSFDMKQKGYRHFISRSYAHHIGQRGTNAEQESYASMDQKSLEWLFEHRPDFLRAYLAERSLNPENIPSLKDKVRVDLLLRQSPPLTPEAHELEARIKQARDTDHSLEEMFYAMSDVQLNETLNQLVLIDPVLCEFAMNTIWNMNRSQPNLLALAIRVGPLFTIERALEWSVRLRTAGLDEGCPLVGIAFDPSREASECVEAAAILHTAFKDERAINAIKFSAFAVPEEEIDQTQKTVEEYAPDLVDTFKAATQLHKGR